MNNTEDDDKYPYSVPNKTDAHVTHNWAPLNTVVNKNFKYVHKNVIFRFFSGILYFIAFIVLFPINSILFGVKTRGRKNLRGLKNGAIIVPNHVHHMDCTFLLTHGAFPRKPYQLTAKEAFDIPIVRGLISMLGAIPIPPEISAKTKCFAEVENLLRKKKLVIIFPEASMWPYYKKLRPFKNGAFKFSLQCNTPIVPACVTFRKPNLFFRMFGKRKPLITVTYLTPIYPTEVITENLETLTLEAFKEYVFNKMNEVITLENKEYDEYLKRKKTKK